MGVISHTPKSTLVGHADNAAFARTATPLRHPLAGPKAVASGSALSGLDPSVRDILDRNGAQGNAVFLAASDPYATTLYDTARLPGN